MNPPASTTQEAMRGHLERLAAKLMSNGLLAELVGDIAKPYLTVALSETPNHDERVLCHQADDGSWVFWWPWIQPIGSVDDLTSVVGKIAAVLRSVAGA